MLKHFIRVSILFSATFGNSVIADHREQITNSAQWLAAFYLENKENEYAACADSSYVAEKLAMSQLLLKQKSITSTQSVSQQKYTENVASETEGSEPNYMVINTFFFDSDDQHCVTIKPINTSKS